MHKENDSIDLAELQKHLNVLKEYQLKTLPEDVRKKLEDEICFWELKLEELK